MPKQRHGLVDFRRKKNDANPFETTQMYVGNNREVEDI